MLADHQSKIFCLCMNKHHSESQIIWKIELMINPLSSACYTDANSYIVQAESQALMVDLYKIMPDKQERNLFKMVPG